MHGIVTTLRRFIEERVFVGERVCRAKVEVCLRERVCWGGKKFMLASEVVAQRWEFIEENALLVSNLDV